MRRVEHHRSANLSYLPDHFDATVMFLPRSFSLDGANSKSSCSPSQNKNGPTVQELRTQGAQKAHEDFCLSGGSHDRCNGVLQDLADDQLSKILGTSVGTWVRLRCWI